MSRTLTYLLSTAWITVSLSFRVLVAVLRGVRHEPGGFFDWVQLEYGRRLLRANGMTVQTEGLAEAGITSPVVFVANHTSWVDIWALLAALPGTTRFVFKKELSRVPFFGPSINAMGHIAIDRANHASAFGTYERAAERIRSGTSAIVFPEGTRSETGKLLPFKRAPFVLAIAAQVPVVPVFCVATNERLPKGSITPRPGPITLRIGTPIPTVGLDYSARTRLADQARAAMLALGAAE